MQQISFLWLLKMAWRDSRKNRGRLFLFISSIILGIAALVAINSFSENLQNDINNEAKTLLGADLKIDGNQPMPDTLLPFINSMPVAERARTISFVSMAYFPKGGNTRLSNIQANEGNFPFYGKVMTQPQSAAVDYKNGKYALIDKSLMIQFDLSVGDSVQVGNSTFAIAGQLDSAPGRSAIAGTIAPLIFIPMDHLDATGLVQTGSRILYQYFYQFAQGIDIESYVQKELAPRLDDLPLDDDTVEERKEQLGEAFDRVGSFLSLIGFIALLLGCIGVASAVHIYIKEKISTIAILRCLGANGQTAFWIYLIQVIILGLLGGILGAVLGTVIQVALPILIGEFLPLENVSNDPSISAISGGILTGLVITVLFALLPLLDVRRISPLRTLRVTTESNFTAHDPLKIAVYISIFLFIFGFSWWQTGDWRSLAFPVAIVVGFLILWTTARLLTWAVRQFFPTQWSYIWRQGIANLYRPNNQTIILVVTIGLGALLISQLFLVRDTLLGQIENTDTNGQPNMIIFDIQKTQREGVIDLVEEYNMPLVQDVPVVAMRLDNVDGIDKKQVIEDSLREYSRWVFDREWRVTYRDSLVETEKIIEGEWISEVGDDGIVYISVAENVAEDLNASVGTKLTFNVQGALVETVVGSIREIEFGKLQTNFFVLFPKGILEKAPQFYVVVSRTKTPEQSADFQQNLVVQYPNASVIDLTSILKTVENVLSKVTFVIRFMALFSILTGLLVLVSSVVLSKFQRIKESVLLRTLGASRHQILWINVIEYAVLGILATLTGIGLSIIGGWLQAHFLLDTPLIVNWSSLLLTFGGIVGATLLIGVLNNREVLNKPPLEVLRKEVG